MSNAQRELQECQKMCAELREQIAAIRLKTNSNLLTQIADNPEVKTYTPLVRRSCTGHFGKIYALHWGINSKYIVTASQDGKLIIWAGMTGNKQLAITLNSAWVMTCGFSDSRDHVASGGLDNTVSVFRTSTRDGGPEDKFKQKDLAHELEKHDGYLSCARFLPNDDNRILSSSGDGTCILWDLASHDHVTSKFEEHSADVMSIALNRSNSGDAGLFVSGSVDATAKVWDYRQGERAVANFPGHDADINTVQWFVDGHSVLTGSDDGTVRLFDMRTYRQLNQYIDKANNALHSPDPAGVSSVDVSHSGQYIFASYENGNVYMWSTLGGSRTHNMPHDSRVSSLGVSPDGFALATGCWDFNMRIYA